MLGERVFRSCGELCCGGEGVDRVAIGGGGCLESARCGSGDGELGQAGGQERSWMVVRNFAVSNPVVGYLVAVGAGDAGDQATVFESAQVVGGLSGGDGARGRARVTRR